MSKTSVSRLFGLGLTPGKLRGLQRICNDNGTLTMVATDQNSSMIKMLKKHLNREPTYDEIVEAKNDLTEALSPVASAILVDGYYGIWNAVAGLRVPKDTGLLVRVERSGGPKNRHNAPMGAVEPGWGVDKIKRFGCDAVKLLAQYEPTEMESAEHQFNFVKQIYEECIENDILLLLETVSFPFGDEKDTSSETYRKRKARTVIDSAVHLSRYCDIYKAEFPGFLDLESEAELQSNLKELNAASERPWVLLSAGVDFPDYEKQVGMAMDAGASGVLGGRAFWKEFFEQGDRAARVEWAKSESVKRVQTVNEIVMSRGTPWMKRYNLSSEEINSMYAAEGWLFRYGVTNEEAMYEKLEAKETEQAASEGDVY